MNHTERIEQLLNGIRLTWDTDPDGGESAGRYLAYLVEQTGATRASYRGVEIEVLPTGWFRLHRRGLGTRYYRTRQEATA